MRRRRPKEVRDWADKKIALMELWHCATQFDIADHVYPDDPSMAIRVQGNLDHWEEHYPIRKDGPGPRFFHDLATLLGLPEDSGARRVINCSLAELVESIAEPQDRQRVIERLNLESIRNETSDSGVSAALDLKASLRPEGPRRLSLDVSSMPDAAPALKALYQNMLVSRRNFLPSVRQAARSGRLDQKHFYLSPDGRELVFSSPRRVLPNL